MKQIRNILQIWSYLLSKYITENFIFIAVSHCSFRDSASQNLRL